MFSVVDDGIPLRMTYTKAIQQPPKPRENGRVTWTTIVSWAGAPKIYQEVEFQTLGKRQIRKCPDLPYGYEMECHKDWFKLYDELFTDRPDLKEISFEELDKVVQDVHLLEELTKISTDSFYYDMRDVRPDYYEWQGSFDDAWNDLEYGLEQYCRAVVKQLLPAHKEPHSSQPDGIGNRVMPPPIDEVFAKLQQLISADTVETLRKFVEDSEG